MRNQQTRKWTSNLQLNDQQNKNQTQRLAKNRSKKNKTSFTNQIRNYNDKSEPQLIIDFAVIKAKDRSLDKSYISTKHYRKNAKQQDVSVSLLHNQNDSLFVRQRKLNGKESCTQMNISILNELSSEEVKQSKKHKRRHIHPSIFKVVRDLKGISEQLKKIVKGYYSMFQAFIDSFQKQLTELMPNKLLSVPHMPLLANKARTLKSRKTKLSHAFQVIDQFVIGSQITALKSSQYSIKNAIQQNKFENNFINQMESLIGAQSPIYQDNFKAPRPSFSQKSAIVTNQISSQIKKLQKSVSQQSFLSKNYQSEKTKQRRPGRIISIKKSQNNISRVSLSKAEQLNLQLQRVTELLNRINNIVS